MSKPILNIVDDKVVLAIGVLKDIPDGTLGEVKFTQAVKDKLNAVAEGGDDGREVELQKSATHIQWRYVGDVDWIDLVSLVELEGPQGDQGEPAPDVYPIQRTGTVIAFDAFAYYNTAALPGTGNITADMTGAKRVIQKIYHQASVEPTYPAGWTAFGDGTYIPDRLNVIYAEYTGAGVEYWIVQERDVA